MIGNGRFCSSTDPCSPNPCPAGVPCVPRYDSGTHTCGRMEKALTTDAKIGMMHVIRIFLKKTVIILKFFF